MTGSLSTHGSPNSVNKYPVVFRTENRPRVHIFPVNTGGMAEDRRRNITCAFQRLYAVSISLSYKIPYPYCKFKVYVSLLPRIASLETIKKLNTGRYHHIRVCSSPLRRLKRGFGGECHPR
jgi:hypothetical protein